MGRPRLAEHVLARRHVSAGREFVVLHDQRTQEIVELAPATWAVLRCADGTRDAHGVVAAASRMGASVGTSAVEDLLNTLDARGMLAYGVPTHDPEQSTIPARAPELEARPVEELPNYTFACTGAGSCCKQYGSVLFTHEDMLRARATLPNFSVGPVPMRRLFLPREGSAPTPVHVPTMKDGACGFLDEQGLCTIHRAGGADAKPHACSAFPMRYCDDGHAIRATACTECICAFISAHGTSPSTPSARTCRDIDPLAVIEVLPAELSLDGTHTLSRDELRAWTHEIGRVEAVADPAQWIWSQAQAASSTGALDFHAPAVEASPQHLAPHLEALRRQVGTLIHRSQSWRASGSKTALALARVHTALKLLTCPDVVASLLHEAPEHGAMEWFYLRANLWGYLDLTVPDLVTCLRDRALRLWLARTLHALDPGKEQGLYLATIDALMRGLGLKRYVLPSR